ncbi:hypothetical protein N2152v2_000712 [Parachlorella kessleri]
MGNLPVDFSRSGTPPASAGVEFQLDFRLETSDSSRPKQLLSPGECNRLARAPNVPKQLFASLSSQVQLAKEQKGSRADGKTAQEQQLEPLPVGLIEGTHKKPYVWDAKQGRLRAVDLQDLSHGEDYGRTVQGHVRRMVHDLQNAFFPEAHSVTSDYWEFARWKAVHRFFSSMSSVFATQSLLRAVGVGAKRSLPAAAAINWVLKDGLGRLGRLTVATRFGESFDSDLKRFRFMTSVMYCSALSLEYITPLFPQHFLVLASLANVGKSVGLTTHIATQPAFHRSFARGENLADISAKAQAQQMVMDNLGLATAVALTHCCSKAKLPAELRSIHLRTLNKERAEIIAEHWLRMGEVPSPLQVSEEERLILPPRITGGCLPLTIGSLHQAVTSHQDLNQLLAYGRNERYFLTYAHPCQPSSLERSGNSQVPRSGAGSSSSSSSCSNSSNYSSSSLRGIEIQPSSRSSHWGPPWVGGLLQRWLGSRQQGRVQIALRKDATHADILQAILQAAYVRQSLQMPTNRENGSSSSDASSSIGGGGGNIKDGSFGSNSTPADPSMLREAARSHHVDASEVDCCEACHTLDRQKLLWESRRKAQSSLRPFMRQLEEHGWQTSPFMLSSTERRGYVLLEGSYPWQSNA